MIRRAAAVWLLLLLVAVTLGAIREAVLAPALGQAVAHVVGTLFGSAVFVAVIALTVPWIDPECRTSALARVGAAWVLATVLFEFGFGRWVVHRPWEVLFADYNVLAGRIWILVLVVLLVTPPVAARMHRAG